MGCAVMRRRLPPCTARPCGRTARECFRPDVDTWHDGRFLERWAAPDVVAALWDSLVRGHDDISAAIKRSVDLFDSLADEISQQLETHLQVRRERTRAMLDAFIAESTST